MRKKILLSAFSMLLAVPVLSNAQIAPEMQKEQLIEYEKKINHRQVVSSSISREYVEYRTIGNIKEEKGTAIIYFDFNSEFLPYRAKRALDSFVKNAPSGAEFTVEASADFLGSNEYNDLLSKRRANNIAHYLMQKDGVAVNRVVGLGKKEAKLHKKCNKNRNKDDLVACIAKDRFGLVTYTLKSE